MGGGEDGFWTKDDNFNFIVVEFEKVVAHPGFNICQAVGEGGKDSWSDGFSGDVELDVIGVAVELKSMAAYNVTEWKHV